MKNIKLTISISVLSTVENIEGHVKRWLDLFGENNRLIFNFDGYAKDILSKELLSEIAENKNVDISDIQVSNHYFSTIKIIETEYTLFANVQDFYPVGLNDQTLYTTDSDIISLETAIMYSQEEEDGELIFDVTVFEKADEFKEKSTLLETFISNGYYYAYYLLGNKLIKTEVLKKSLDNLSKEVVPYIFLNSDNYLTINLLICTSLFDVANTNYQSNLKMVLNWKEYDKLLQIFANHFPNRINSLKKPIEYISGKAEKSGSDMNKLLQRFIARLWWRIEWAIDKEKHSDYKTLLFEVSGIDDFDSLFPGVVQSQDKLKKDDYFVTKIEEENDEKYEDLNVHIYVSTHKEAYFPKIDELIPIQVGSELTEKRIPGTITDNTGNNLSPKNKRYNELTAQYWAWKNDLDADYYGIFHYRRYLAFNEDKKGDVWGILPNSQLTDEALEEMYIDSKHIKNTVGKYDLILPIYWEIKEEGKVMTLLEHWEKHFPMEDLEVMFDVIEELYPEILPSAKELFESTSAPFFNIFIMKKSLFEEYNEFCFNVLREVENRVDHENYDVERYRMLGHLAERLVGIFATYLKNNRKEILIHNLPVAQFFDTTPLPAETEPIVTEGKKHIPIVMACDEAYMKYTSVLLESIYENASEDNFYDIIILHQNINDETLKKVSPIKNNISLRGVNVKLSFNKYKNLHISRHITLETYYRFLIPDLFDKYSKILYLDCDMVVDDDVAKLYSTDLKDNYVGAVVDYDFSSAVNTPRQKELYEREILSYLQLNEPTDYFQAGVILFNLEEIRKNYSSADLFEVAMIRDWYYHDQDILNYLFKGKVKYLDPRWNVLGYGESNSGRQNIIKEHLPWKMNQEYNKSRLNPGIIHFAGEYKPWLRLDCDFSEAFWQYAKSSNYYELLFNELQQIPQENRNFVFINNNGAWDKGVHCFSIKPVKEVYTSSIAILDVVSLKDQGAVSSAELTISCSTLPNESGSFIKLIDFKWNNKIPGLNDYIGVRVNQQTHEIELWARNNGQYSGFAIYPRILESRAFEKPRFRTANQNRMVNGIQVLPNDVQFNY